ncbi:hypothetical protein [Ekhidna sp.]
MNKVIALAILFLSFFSNSILGQEPPPQSLDSLKMEILNLQTDVQSIQLNMSKSKKTLKRGIFIATIGYTITIIGGQLLGVRPQIGEALLYAGGAVGIGGTAILVNGFNKMDQFDQSNLNRKTMSKKK